MKEEKICTWVACKGAERSSRRFSNIPHDGRRSFPYWVTEALSVCIILLNMERLVIYHIL
ncbi:rCG55887 [Rattus norvegicus]|uniref:RCG55887 n=1 Tax=Rattus norvegicus TaxID=10116 RepID=A6JLV9_RAT|nr:rCG55887 [Rattus norvegicus]